MPVNIVAAAKVGVAIHYPEGHRGHAFWVHIHKFLTGHILRRGFLNRERRAGHQTECGSRHGQYECFREGANKQVISSQADSLIKISRIWADFFPANTSNQPI